MGVDGVGCVPFLGRFGVGVGVDTPRFFIWLSKERACEESNAYGVDSKGAVFAGQKNGTARDAIGSVAA